jgi:hypothetical protein
MNLSRAKAALAVNFLVDTIITNPRSFLNGGFFEAMNRDAVVLNAYLNRTIRKAFGQSDLFR